MAEPDLPVEIIPPEEACETAPPEAQPAPSHCVLCGRARRGWTAAAAGLGGATERCEACYCPLPAGALFCAECGRRAAYAEVEAWRKAHAAAGRFCTAAGPVAASNPPRRSPRDDPPGFENIREVALGFGIILGVVLFNYAWVHYTEDKSVTCDFVFSALLYAAIAALAWHWRASVMPLCRWPDLDLKAVLAIVLTPVLTLAAVEGQGVLAKWLHLPVYSYLEDYTRDGYSLWVAAVFIAVLPAIFEEIAFRGIILSKLRLVMTRHQALLATSILFAAIHFNIIGLFVFLVPLAYLGGWATIRTNSLLPAMAIHFLHNSGVLLLEYLGL